MTERDSLSNSWKASADAFDKQLAYNKMELNSYPNHWHVFLWVLKNNKTESILDIGCGCGTFYQLCKEHFPRLRYTGIDYSQKAIDIARSEWSEKSFICCDYKTISKGLAKEYDMIHMGAFLDVMPNGDEVLCDILDLEPKSVLIGRVKLTDKESYYNTYTAYDEIETCEFYHNREFFLRQISTRGYSIQQIDNNFYLEKK